MRPVARPQGSSYPRSARLLRATEFERALRHPDLRLRQGALRLSAVANRMHDARLGLIVPKRVVAKAYARNRVKRVIREWFRQARADLPEQDLVIQVFRSRSGRLLRVDLVALGEQLCKPAATDAAQ